jgi:predicted dehydrogenase
MKRKTFIYQTALTASSLLLSGKLLAFSGSPANKVRIAVMGVNSRGLYLALAFAKLKDVDVAYICDPEQNALNKAVEAVEKIAGRKPQAFVDIRKLVEQKDFDALVIAAPDHWHAPAAIMALQAGKHVYVEKPCSHNPKEGELLVAAQKKYNRSVQMGSQRRSFTNVQNMIRKLHEGVIGRVYFAKGWYTNQRPSIGIGKKVPVPANLNFDLWQGPAPRRAYQDNLVHYNWHWFWHWGTGESLNNGTHELDVMRWGLGVDYPIQVSSGGGRFHFKDDWETPDTQTITYNFPNNTGCTWEGRSCNGFGVEGLGRGVIFYGDKGTLFYPGANDYTIYNNDKKPVEQVKDDTPYDPNNKVSPTEVLDALHLQNFVDAIRGDAKLTAPIIEGHKSTLLPQLGNIAYRAGRVLNCNPENGHILNDKEAAKLWSRTYERGWEVKL